MNVLGSGSVSTVGRGAEALRSAVARGWTAPSMVEVPFLAEPFPVYTVDAEVLKDRAVLGSMRRADRFSKMAALAAYDAVAESGLSLDRPERVGILFASAFGPHNTTFKFLDEILDYGDAGVSPTVFSHSVHGAAVSYISQMLGVHGPVWTITRFNDPFRAAVQMAEAWLSEGRCDYVLVGAGDECGSAMEAICAMKLPIAQDGRVSLRAPQAYVPGEGAAFFLLGGGDDGRALPTSPACYAELLGNMLSGRALDCAVELAIEK
jgi:3-oxoacyl-[acyl-carrier-protein] synthase II